MLTLRLLHVDFNRVERHVGMELGNISGPVDMKQSCQLLENSVRRSSVHKGPRHGRISSKKLSSHY